MTKLKATLGARWMSETDITTALSKARCNRQAQQRLLGSLHEKIERRGEDVTRSLVDIPASQRTPITNKAVSGFRNELKRESADGRLAYVREAGRHVEQIRSVASHYRSPVQMLARQTLGSDRRSRLIQQINSSGAAELASLAEFAAATMDLELGAALCSRVVDLPRDKRPFSTAELADALLGEKHRTVTQALMEIERLAVEAVQDDSAFETGRRNTQRSVEIALMNRAEGAIGAALPDEDSDTQEKEI